MTPIVPCQGKELANLECDSIATQRAPRTKATLDALEHIMKVKDTFVSKHEAVLTAMEFFESQETISRCNESKGDTLDYGCYIRALATGVSCFDFVRGNVVLDCESIT